MNGWTWDPESIIAVASVAVVIVAVITTIAAWLSTRQSRKALWGQLILQLTGVYAEPEMGEGMRRIVKWYEDYKNDFDKAAKELALRRENKDDEKANEVDRDRRRFIHYIHAIWLLRVTKVVNKKFVRHVVSRTQRDFLLKYVKRFEKAIAKHIGQPFNEEPFRFFERLYPKKLYPKKSDSQ